MIQTKKWIKDYFEDIPRGDEVIRKLIEEPQINKTIKAKTFDPNIEFSYIFSLQEHLKEIQERQGF